MKIFLSSLERAGTPLMDYQWVKHLDELPFKLKWNLMSYFYVRKEYERSLWIRDHSEEVMIDSGAHSFQKGQKVEWEQYTQEYADFIRTFDRPNIIGYFEMDVDVIIGYERVLQLRKILQSATNKLIPVWHKGRGLEEFDRMCREFSGRIVAISGFKNEDIADDQYIMFLKRAKHFGCRLHCLGMTRRKILDRVPFDYVDSSSWRQDFTYARVILPNGRKKKVNSDWFRVHENRDKVELMNYQWGVRMQKHYYEKWRKFDEDSQRAGRRDVSREREDDLQAGV